MKCAWRACSKEVFGRKDKKYCSGRCARNFYTSQNRRRFKQRAVDLLGGKCSECGYNRSLRGLTFHHLDPKQKEFGIASGNTMSWERFSRELAKCILLCSNCHAELEESLL